MEWIEITRKTVTDAVDAALDMLGVDEDEVEYEVLEEPRRSFLGFGGGGARIRARVKPVSREKTARRARRRDGRPSREEGAETRLRPAAPASGSSSRTLQSAPPPDEERAGGAAGSRNARRRRRPRTEGGPSGTTTRDGGTRESTGGRTRSGGGRSGGGQSSGDQPRDQARSPQPRADQARGDQPRRDRPSDGAMTDREETRVVGLAGIEQGHVDLARDFVEGLVREFGLNATVHARQEDEDLFVEVNGEGLGILIGPRSTTIDAVEELVRTVIQRHGAGNTGRVHLDVGGYRARRAVLLSDFARQAAERARETGRDQAFEPMSSGDRKVVHDAVSGMEGVTTISEGEEPRRRVVVKKA